MANDQPTTRTRRPTRWGPTLLLAGSLTVYFFVTRPAAAPLGWSEDFDAAAQQAAVARKNLVIDFHSDGCPPCLAMDRNVLPTPQVQQVLTDFVPVRVNVGHRPELSARFNVAGTPTYVIATPAGEVLARSEGYQTPEMFVAFLSNASSPTNTVSVPLPGGGS